MQVTEWKYSIPVTRYGSLSNKVYFVPTSCTCPVIAGLVTFIKILDRNNWQLLEYQKHTKDLQSHNAIFWHYCVSQNRIPHQKHCVWAVVTIYTPALIHTYTHIAIFNKLKACKLLKLYPNQYALLICQWHYLSCSDLKLGFNQAYLWEFKINRTLSASVAHIYSWCIPTIS